MPALLSLRVTDGFVGLADPTGEPVEEAGTPRTLSPGLNDEESAALARAVTEGQRG